MKHLAAPLRYIAALLPLVMSLQAGAVAVCESPDSDPDRDGWGWENDASCVVSPATLRQPPPICESDTSDSDNDGWGWENDASCKVQVATDGGEYPAPGTTVANATNVAVGTTLQATLKAGDVHWYSVDIVDTQFAFEVASSSGDPADFIDATIEDSSGYIVGGITIYGGDSRSTPLCLSPGRHYISVSSFPELVEQPVYKLSVNDTGLRCLQPELPIQTDNYTEAFATIAGGIVYTSADNDLIAITHDGQLLWEVENVLDFFISNIVVGDDQMIYAYNGGEIAAVTPAGDPQWTYRMKDGQFIDHVAVDSRGIYLLADFRNVIGLDLNGTEQWIAPDISFGGANTILIGDDGTLYLHGYNSIAVLQP